MIQTYDSFIAGYTCIDLIPGFKNNPPSSISNLFRPGKLIEIDGLDFVLGGVVPNTGLTMRNFGKKVFLNGLIGDDSIGIIAEDLFNHYGISEGIIKTKEESTAYSVVIAPPGVDRIFLESPGCNKIFSTDHINFEIVSKSRLFHFGYPPLLRKFFLNDGELLTQLYSRVKKMEVITSLDFSLPDPESESGKINWPAILKTALPFVDVFVPSVDEVFQIMKPDKFDEMSALSNKLDVTDKKFIDMVRKLGRTIIDSGVKILLIKMGARGAYLLTGEVSSLSKKADSFFLPENWDNREILCHAYPADDSKITNASGAGDISIAAFLSAVLDGETPEMAIKFATIAGRDSLYCENIFNDMSTWEKLLQEIKSEINEIIILK